MKRLIKIKMMTDILNEKFRDIKTVEFTPGNHPKFYQINVNVTYPEGDRLLSYKQKEVIRRMRNIRTQVTDINKIPLSAASAIIAAGIYCMKSETNFVLIVQDKPVKEEPYEDPGSYSEEDKEWMIRLIESK